MRLAATILLALGASASLSAHEVISTKLTWSQEISRIIYKRCASCHRENGSAPMSLMTYEEARPWAKAIKEEVLERRMPPWGAVKGFGQFREDPSLTAEEMHLIADWVEGGAPQGDPAYAPYPPGFSEEKEEPAARGAVFKDGLTLSRTTMLAGIRTEDVREGASLRVIAERPDGVVEPLLWLYQYRPKWKRTYWFEQPLALPKGTRIRILPPEGASLAAVPAPPNAKSSPGR
jgi:hypothetical protein